MGRLQSCAPHSGGPGNHEQAPRSPEHRKADWPIESLFLRRWSPRAMTGEALRLEELKTLFEAARWAPRPTTSRSGASSTPAGIRSTGRPSSASLVGGNQAWCKDAAVLVVVLSHKVFARNGKPNPVHTFDTGAAFENLALQGAAMRLVVHGMAGFDRDQARQALGVPRTTTWRPWSHRQAETDRLSPRLRKMEVPSGRRRWTRSAARSLRLLSRRRRNSPRGTETRRASSRTRRAPTCFFHAENRRRRDVFRHTLDSQCPPCLRGETFE